MNVLVVGASSQIGQFLLPRLHARGDCVLALSRHPQPEQPGARWLQGGLPDAMPELTTDLAAIVSFGPLLPFAQWLAQAAPANAPRVIATSSMSAQSKQDSSVPAERAIAQQLCDGEEALAAACRSFGSAWTILRPTLIYGAGRDRSLSPIARRAAHMRLFPLPAGRGLRQPVHADDIAQAVVAALDRAASAGRVLPIGGGERLSAGEMFARVRRSLPRRTVPIPLPRWVLRGGRLLAPALRGALGRLDVDLIADNRELEELLGIRPRVFQPDARCWFP
jgi:nucleoside-diphosphate-sugar epimerase